jgi:hypothetical protein
VAGNRILDPAGNRYIIKGANAVYGRFAGGDPLNYGLYNYQNAQRDLLNLKNAGGNTIRVMTSYNDYVGGPLGQAEYLTELDNVVAWATGIGIVVDLASADWRETQANVVAMDSLLAGRYKSNPRVWINVANEPNCSGGDTTKCYDWAYWQMSQSQDIQAIRATGFTNPVVVDGIGWAWDLSRIGSYPMGDANVIFAAHRYGNTLSVWDATQTAQADSLWGNLAASYPIFVEEIGYDNGPGQISPETWCVSFLDNYAVTWVNLRQGSGIMPWIDSWWNDTMTNRPDGSWSQWGLDYRDHYMARV